MTGCISTEPRYMHRSKTKRHIDKEDRQTQKTRIRKLS